jgi:hypothetical protein
VKPVRRFGRLIRIHRDALRAAGKIMADEIHAELRPFIDRVIVLARHRHQSGAV